MHQLEYDWWETPLVGQVDKETKRILEITIWNKKSEIFNYRKTGGGKKWVRFTVNFGDSTDKEDKGHSTAVVTYFFGYLCPTFPGARASRSLLLSFRVHFACSISSTTQPRSPPRNCHAFWNCDSDGLCRLVFSLRDLSCDSIFLCPTPLRRWSGTALRDRIARDSAAIHLSLQQHHIESVYNGALGRRTAGASYTRRKLSYSPL